MPRFRKKPVEIEAIKVEDVLKAALSGQWRALPSWVALARKISVIEVFTDHVIINSLESRDRHRGDFDDWIIQGVKGELYPCKPDIFEMTYEEVL